MSKKVLAVSGGVDSMIMLEMLQNNDVLVVHFDHGTRASSREDAALVEKVAQGKKLDFVTKNGELGEGVSEELARKRRYDFLRRVSSENDGAEIYTAHHLDDLVETVAINLLRGTGWRGLAVLDAPGVRRPFLEPELLPGALRKLVPLDKKAIQQYAANFKVVYRQDPTNNEDNYLRNRVREKLKDFDKKTEIYELWQKQKQLKKEINQIVRGLLPAAGQPWEREWFRDLDQKVALELLRAGTLRAGISATRPQLEDFRQAILHYGSGKSFNLPGDKLVKFSKTEFYL